MLLDARTPSKLIRPIALAVVLTVSGAAGGMAPAADCTVTSVGRTPLDDLGPGLYQGWQGGLYPQGARDRPASHERTLDLSGRVQLLDQSGNPDPASGKIVLMSVGMSNTTQEFSQFKSRADADPLKNSRLVIVDAAQGGQDAATIANPAAAYWTGVDQKLQQAGVTPAQVQSVWLKQAMRTPTGVFPADANLFRDTLRSIVQIIKSRYPNTRSVYISSRIYAGYATTTLNPEPYAYQSAFSVKWLVEEQIAGSPLLNFDPARGAVAAPWLSWGPYLWADGLVPRSDGMIWQCSDFQSDGTHPSPSGREKVAARLLAFFKADATTSRWFVDCDLASPGVFGPPPEVLGAALAREGGGLARLAWQSLAAVVGPAVVYDLVHGSVSELRADSGYARASCLASGLTAAEHLDAVAEPAPGDAVWYLVRGRNSCGTGTWGDSSLRPDPRDALDAAGPACH